MGPFRPACGVTIADPAESYARNLSIVPPVYSYYAREIAFLALGISLIAVALILRNNNTLSQKNFLVMVSIGGAIDVLTLIPLAKKYHERNHFDPITHTRSYNFIIRLSDDILSVGSADYTSDRLVGHIDEFIRQAFTGQKNSRIYFEVTFTKKDGLLRHDQVKLDLAAYRSDLMPQIIYALRVLNSNPEVLPDFFRKPRT